MSIDEIVRSRGGRMTVQRRLILDELARARHDTTADEITRRIRAHHPQVDTSTVYRNLEALERLGAVRHVHVEGRPTRWQRTELEHHGHLVCRSCGAETEVPLRTFATLARRLERAHGFHADLAHSAIIGTCRRCAPQRERRSTAGRRSGGPV